MEKKIRLKDKEIQYKLRRSQKAKQMRLSIYCDGRFVVTLPQRWSFLKAEKFIMEKANWVLNKLDYFSRKDQRLLARSHEEYFQHKVAARRIAQEKVAHFNQFYGFACNRIAIRNQKSRWGSCSRNANLNFNYKIVFLPEHLVDYIVVHEICHLKEFNHSQRFWDLMAKSMPNYRELKRELMEL